MSKLDEVAAIVEAEYFDAEFLGSHWPAKRAEADRRLAQAPEAEHEVVRWMLGELGVSHCVLLAASDLAAMKAAAGDPRRLSPVLRQVGSLLYVRIGSFKVATTTSADIEGIRAALDGADHVVLDLRLNDGGSGAKVAELAGLFVAPGEPVLTVRDRAAESVSEPVVITTLADDLNADHQHELSILRSSHWVEYRTLDTGNPFQGRITILTDARCYSCGEVFAQAIKEYTSATLIGRRTAGMVVAATEFPLESGGRLLFPFADMTSGKGYRIEGSGVAPHVDEDLSEAAVEEILVRLA